MTDEKTMPRRANLHVGAFEIGTMWDDTKNGVGTIGTMWDDTKNGVGTIGTRVGQ